MKSFCWYCKSQKKNEVGLCIKCGRFGKGQSTQIIADKKKSVSITEMVRRFWGEAF